MSFLSNLFSNGAGGLLSGIGGIIDKFQLSPKDREQMKLEMEGLLMQKEKDAEDTYRLELQSKTQIMQAELTQGDNYTKRARPTIIYAGLIFIMLELFGLRHFFLYHLYPDKDMLKEMMKASDGIFNTFLITWASVAGVYSIGRTVEKSGKANQVTNFITGSGAANVSSTKAQG
jgi:hypothetical protein